MIKPHPLFRVFLTVDPTGGDTSRQISKALRNRCLEIYVGDMETPSPDVMKSQQMKFDLLERASDLKSSFSPYHSPDELNPLDR